MNTDALIERLQAVDPARRDVAWATPSVALVHAARRRRRRAPVAGAVFVAAATGLLALLPALRADDVVARAAAALRSPGVLHMHSITRTRDGHVSGVSESWRAANGDQRSLLRGADGRLVGEITIRDGVASSWNARSDELYRSRNSALDDPLEQLSRANAGHRGVSRRADTTVRGIPVHVIVLSPTVAGEDPVPARTYYIDKHTNLPVRIAFGITITDVLQTETLPWDGAAGELRMAPHPSATVHDLR